MQWVTCTPLRTVGPLIANIFLNPTVGCKCQSLRILYIVVILGNAPHFRIKPRVLPGQQCVEVIWGGGVRTQRWRGHVGSRLGPVLAPVMRAVGCQASCDGLPKNHSTCTGWWLGCLFQNQNRWWKAQKQKRPGVNVGEKRSTFPPSLSDGVSCAPAHHLCDVDGTVHTVTQSDGTEHCLSFQLHGK